MRKQRRFTVTVKLISAFVFATQIVQSLHFLNLKVQASSHLVWLYSLVCVGPGRKPRRPVFSQRGSFVLSHLVRQDVLHDLRHDNTCLPGFRLRLTQSRLYNYRIWQRGLRLYYLYSENKGTDQLHCISVLAYAKIMFSHDADYMWTFFSV